MNFCGRKTFAFFASFHLDFFETFAMAAVSRVQHNVSAVRAEIRSFLFLQLVSISISEDDKVTL